MSSSTLAGSQSVSNRRNEAAARLAVTWQHPHGRRHEPVGLLTCDDKGFHFKYLHRASSVEGFQPFLGFDELYRTYSSRQLFPLFTQRIIRSGRPDFPKFLQALQLENGASDWQILARSHGQREGDGIRVFMEPYVGEDGQTITTFLAHGVRHRLLADSRVESALKSLSCGDQLSLVDEPDNPVDPSAILVSSDGHVMLGWVPTVLLPYVHKVQQHGKVDVKVMQSSGPDIPPAYRLLVELSGQVNPGHRPFDGPAWILYEDGVESKDSR